MSTRKPFKKQFAAKSRRETPIWKKQDAKGKAFKQLNSRVVGKMPMMRAMRLADGAVHTFPFRTLINATVTDQGILNVNGTAAGTADVVFAVEQKGILYQSGNGVWTSVGFQTPTSYPAIFQKYRISKFDMEVFYSSNSAQGSNNASTTQSLAQIICVKDSENDNSLTSTVEALSFASSKFMQLGNSSGINNGKQSIAYADPPCLVGADNDTSLAGTLTAAMLSRNQWIDTTVVTIPHGFIKCWAPTTSFADAHINGTITFVFDCIIQYKGIE